MRIFDVTLLAAFILVGAFACAMHAAGDAAGGISDSDANWGDDAETTLAPPDPGAVDRSDTATASSDDAHAEQTPDSNDADASLDATPAAPDGACAEPLAPGALMIDELMIESVAGSGDDGEWFEVRSTRSCAMNLRGLHGSCAHGSKVALFDVTGDMWLPPGGTFVVADSSDPAINHELPGTMLVWFGQPGDVLRNKGGTVTLSADGATIDSLTYPSMSLAVGVALAFPSDCDASVRSDFKLWQRATGQWFPAFYGTPNAPNADVSCPAGP